MQSFQMTLHPACLEMHMAQFVALEIVLKPVEHKRHKPYITKYKGTSKCVLLAVVADPVFVFFLQPVMLSLFPFCLQK